MIDYIYLYLILNAIFTLFYVVATGACYSFRDWLFCYIAIYVVSSALVGISQFLMLLDIYHKLKSVSRKN